MSIIRHSLGFLLLLSACQKSSAPARFEDAEPALTQVTLGRAGADRDPELSPDGQRLFFASTAHGETSDLYVKAVGGNAVTRLTTMAGDVRFPRVSPADPRMLAFCSNERGPWEIYVMSDWMEQPGKLVIVSEKNCDSLAPSWSPDGQKLVYCSSSDPAAGDWVLKVKDLASGKTSRLEGVEGLLPRWSPSGNRIAFQRMKQRDAWLSSVWTLDFEDGVARNVTCVFSNDERAALQPAWSPDARRLVLATTAKSLPRPGALVDADDLWLVNVDGSNPVRLTSSAASDAYPSWSRDGSIYFSSDRSGSVRVWRVTP